MNDAVAEGLRRIKQHYDVLVLGGAPGSGKTTVARLLRAALHTPYIDLSWLRGLHLNDSWSDATPAEEQMSFENLVFITENYLRHGIHPVILSDFLDERLQKLPQVFAGYQLAIVTLMVSDADEHSRRASVVLATPASPRTITNHGRGETNGCGMAGSEHVTKRRARS